MTSISVDEIVAWFAAMSEAALADLAHVYREDATFKDPFNEVQGLPAIRKVYARMYEALLEPRFDVMNRLVDGPQAVFEWDFHFRIRRFRPDESWTIHGTSHLRFAGDGRIAYHRDYWDTGEELYAKLPLIGAAVRFLRRRMG